MQNLRPLKPQPKTTLVCLLLLSLSSCGFLTAPLTHSTALLAGGSVKAAEAGRQGTVKAAIVVKDISVDGYHRTVEVGGVVLNRSVEVGGDLLNRSVEVGGDLLNRSVEAGGNLIDYLSNLEFTPADTDKPSLNNKP